MTVSERSDLPAESGFTLIELLITIVILALAVVAMVGAMTVMLSTSGLHRRQADVSSVVENAAEALKATSYVACAGTGSYSTPVSSESDVGKPTVTAVKYWNGSNFVAGSCTADQGMQMVQVTATSTDGSVTQTISLVKANR